MAPPHAATRQDAADPRPGGGQEAAAPAPTQDGFVDFFGYAAAAGGWLFCGWSAERWDDGEGAIAAHFEQAYYEGALKAHLNVLAAKPESPFAAQSVMQACCSTGQDNV